VNIIEEGGIMTAREKDWKSTGRLFVFASSVGYTDSDSISSLLALEWMAGLYSLSTKCQTIGKKREGVNAVTSKQIAVSLVSFSDWANQISRNFFLLNGT